MSAHTPLTVELLEALKVADEALAAAWHYACIGMDGTDFEIMKRRRERVRAAISKVETPEPSFQARVQPWMLACFNAEIAADELERADRFIEEALELVQAKGYGAERAYALVDYVFGRPVGEPDQEVGGVMVTLAALCLAAGLDMHQAGERELARISAPAIMEKIRAKQAAKPNGSALPVATLHAASAGPGSGEGERLHLMHEFGRKCSECGRMTWPGMAGAAPRWTWDRAEWASAPDNCASPSPLDRP